MAKAQPRGRRKRGLDVDFELDESSALEEYTFADDVVDNLTNIGVGREERPRIMEDHESILVGLEAGDYFDGRLPVVIRKLSLDQLSALYSLFSNWYGYLMFQTQKAAVQRSEAKVQKEMLYAMIRQQKRFDEDGNKRDGPSMTNLTHSDGRFIAANAKYIMLDGLYEGLDAMVKIAAQDMKVISREVTIQQTKLEHDGVRKNMPRRFKAKSVRPEDGDGAEKTRSRRKKTGKKVRRRTRG